nr:MAG: hypothetical protein [Longquan bat nodavirus 1]
MPVRRHRRVSRRLPRRVNTAVPVVITNVRNVRAPPFQSSRAGRRSRPARRLRRGRRVATARPGISPLAGMSQASVNFLKTATSLPDFADTEWQGVPDQYAGRSLSRVHFKNTAIAVAANTDMYLIIPPVPGVSNWQQSVPIGTAPTGPWSTNGYADYDILFNANGINYSQNLTGFRFGAMAAELECTTNDMNWNGSIVAARQLIAAGDAPDNVVGAVGSHYVNLSLIGFNGLINMGNSNAFIAPINQGVYMVSLNEQATFEFQHVTPPLNQGSTLPCDNGSTIPLSPFPGIDTISSIVFRISNPSTTPQALIFRSWAAVEYQPLPSSMLFGFSHWSASYDPAALAAYKALIERLPIAVPQSQNATFWQHVLRVLSGLTTVGSLLPGPLGALARFAGPAIQAANYKYNVPQIEHVD